AAERSGGRDGDEDAIPMNWIKEDRVQTQTARAGLPSGSRFVRPETGQLAPGLSAVGGPEHRCIFDARVHGVSVGRRRFQMPDALELPGMRRPVVPLMGPGDALVHELVAHRLPGLAAVAGPLNDLAEPAARLRGIEPVGIGRRRLQVIDLPSGEVRTADAPPL